MIINPLNIDIDRELWTNKLNNFFYDYEWNDDWIIKILNEYETKEIYRHLKWYLYEYDRNTTSIFEKISEDIESLLAILNSDIDIDEKYMSTKAIINSLIFEWDSYDAMEDIYYKLSNELQSEKILNKIKSFFHSYPTDIVSVPKEKIEIFMTILSLVNARVSEYHLSNTLAQNEFEIKNAFIDSFIYILSELNMYLLYKNDVINNMNIWDVNSIFDLYE